MTLFEAGIIAKMTTDEYKNLPEHARRSDPVTESDKQGGEVLGDSAATSSQTVRRRLSRVLIVFSSLCIIFLS